MKKQQLLIMVMALFVLIIAQNSFAQLSGTKTIPGDYATITAAITDLNTQGVGTGGVIFNVASGYTETAFNLVLTCPVNPPGITKPIVFQKSGAGANPLITAGTGVSLTLDGIIILNGVSYVTFDGIDLQENPANTTPTAQMEWGYALVKQSAILACQNNTIKNCTVTLNKANTASVGIYAGNHLASSVTALTVSQFMGTASYNKFYNNTIQNCYLGYSISGYAALSPYDLYDQGNEVGTISGGRSQVLNFGGSTLAAYGVYGTNQNGMKIFNTNVNSTGGVSNTGVMYGIYTLTGLNANVDIYGDTVKVVRGAGTTNALYGINNNFGGTGQGNIVNIYNNVVSGCTDTTATSAEFRGINIGGTATNINIYGNRVVNNLMPGTGAFTGIYLGASSSTNMLVSNIYNNEVSGNTKTGTAGTFYMCYVSSSSQVINFYNNLLFNNTANVVSTGTMYGYYNFAFGFGENVYNNQIYNCSNGAGEFVAFNVKSGSGPTDKNIYGNTVYGLTGAAAVGAIFMDYSTNGNVYKNNIYNLSSSNTALIPSTYGIQLGTNVNMNVSIYNNFISELKAPLSTSTGAVYGMYIQGVAGPNNMKVYYNTVYLNATSSSVTTFGTAALAYSNITATSNLDLRNNILVNNSTPGPTGGNTVAFQRSTTVLSNYNLVSGNNLFYAGTPGTNRLIHNDGINSDQTIQSYKDRVTPRDQASFTELPPFVNVASSPYDLHVQTTVPTQLESGGQPVVVTTDFDGQVRSSTFPDVGADEFSGLRNDLASPNIQYAFITNGSVASPRLLTGFAVITDPDGINTTAGTSPRIYFKKSVNANTYNDNTSATDGWKYTEATNSVSPFNFSIDYTKLLGGTVSASDTIQYFVVAQDANVTPKVGLNAGAFTTQPATVNLAAANFPLTSTINKYIITANTYSGSINVGTTETITSLTNAGGLFQLLNTGVLSGNLTVNITSDLTAELGTFALNQLSEVGAGGYTVTIQPSAATLRTISGTVALGLVRLDGARRTIIDGRFGGSGSYLLFRNLNTTNPTVHFLNDAQNNTLRNTIIESPNTLTTSGAVVIGTTTGVNGNDNNVITYNEIRNRTDVVAYYSIGVYCAGTITSLPQFNNNCTISNNNIHDYFIDGGTQQAGVFVSTGNSGFNIDSNSIYQTSPRVMTISAALIYGIGVSNTSPVAANGNFNIRNNYVGGSAPLCGGAAMNYNVSSTTQQYALRCITIITGQIPNTVSGNTVANFDLTCNVTATNNFLFCGIGTGQGITNVTNNTVGATTGNDNIKCTLNGSAAGLSIVRGTALGQFTSTVWGGVNDNNRVGSFTIGGTAGTAGVFFEGVSVQGSAGIVGNVSMSNNVIGSTTTPNSIRTTYAAASTNLRAMSVFPVTGYDIVLNNNTIQNLTDSSTSASSALFGVLSNSAGVLRNVITNNTFSDLRANNTGAFINDLVGVYMSTLSTNNLVSGNTFKNLILSNTGAFNSGLEAILTLTNNNSGGTIEKNKIYNIMNLSTGSAPSAYGIYHYNGADWRLLNNMISMTNGEPTAFNKVVEKFDNRVEVSGKDISYSKVLPGYEVPANYNPQSENNSDIKEEITLVDNSRIENKALSNNGGVASPNSTNNVQLLGIYDASLGGTKSVYFNSIYVGGSAPSGASNSYCFSKSGTGSVILRNNLLYNNRSSLGRNYAIGNIAAILTQGWNSVSSDFNAFIVPDTNYVGEWGSGVGVSSSGWRTSSLGDNQTQNALTSFIPAANLFRNISVDNLNVDSTQYYSMFVYKKGTGISGITSDFNGSPRNTSGPVNIGADEFAYNGPLTPVLLTPSNNSIGLQTPVFMNWRKGLFANGYRIQISTDSLFGSFVINTLVPDSTYNFTGANALNTYYWRVNPTYASFPEGGFSSRFKFKTIGSPTTVVLSAPANNAVDQPLSLTFNWFKATDQTTGPLTVSNYWFEMATDTGFVSIVNRDSTLTDTTKSIAGLSNNNKYYWRVKAKNQFGWAGFSSVWNFTTIPNIPNSIVLISPANNATNQPFSNLTFTWSKALETLMKKGDNGKASPLSISNYWFELATDAGFTTVVNRDSLLTDTTKTIATLTSNINYWWRVKAKNQLGWGSFTGAFTFKTTLDPTFLAQANFTSVLTPQVMSGGGNTTRLPIVIRATVSNLVPNKLYRFYNGGAIYSDLGTGAYGAGNSMFINPDSTNNRYTTSVSLTTLGGYDVFRADGSGNCTRWFSFIGTGNATRFIAGKYVIPSIVIGDSLGAVIARYALNDSIKVVNISSNTADTCGTGIYGISVAFPKNIVSLYDNTGGTGKPLTQTYLEDEGVTVATVVPFYNTFVNAQNGRWGTVIPNVNANGVRRVEQRDKSTGSLMTFNSSAAGLWPTGVNTVNPTGGLTPLGLLLNDAPLLDYATLVSPANNAVNQAVSLTLSWNTVTYASSYRVQLASDSAFTTIVKDSIGLTANSYTVTGLLNNQSYWWRVAGTTTTGTAPFGTAFKFTTIPNAPTAPVLLSPANTSTGNPLSLNLVWSKPLLATGYNVVLATDAGFTSIVLNDSTLTDSVKALINLTPLTTYYWKVRAKNAGGWSSFSSAFNFKTVGSASQVVLSSPANNATGQPTTLTFKWFKAVDLTLLSAKQNNKKEVSTSDELLAVSNYWFELSTDSTFVTGVTRDSTLTDTTKSVSGLNTGTNYYWRVKAKNQIGWGTFSARFKFTTLVPTLTLNLKVYLEGFWNGTTQVSDTVTVYLANSTTFTLTDTAKVVLTATGTASMNFNRVTTGSYYVVVNHRNHLETWSKLPQSFVGGTPFSYDFTTAMTQAFGDNMKQVGTVWVLFGGDANTDGSIDGLDVTLLVPQFGTQGYLAADFDGDQDVTGLDVALFVPNFGMTKVVPTLVVIPVIKTKDFDYSRIDSRLTQKDTKKQNNNNVQDKTVKKQDAVKKNNN